MKRKYQKKTPDNLRGSQPATHNCTSGHDSSGNHRFRHEQDKVEIIFCAMEKQNSYKATSEAKHKKRAGFLRLF